jgi:hypothetical protein
MEVKLGFKIVALLYLPRTLPRNPMDSQALSFEQAIVQTHTLLEQQSSHQIDDRVFAEQIGELLTTEEGARGFFVTFLTGDWQVADRDCEAVIQALKVHPQPELLVKNLVMSTAMKIYHDRASNLEQAAGSARVAKRTAQLINCLITPELQAIAKDMHDSTQGTSEIYQSFLQKWGYDLAQKEAIAQCLSNVF